MFKTVSFLVFALLAACTQEEPTSRSYPRLDTQEITQITQGGAVFNGQVTYTSVAITDHGFVWSNVANFKPDEADLISLGAKSGAGTFSAPCTYALQEGEIYYVRAYAKSNDHAVYGDMMTFVSRGAEPPILNDFYPKEGTWDDEITIAGKNLSAIENNIILKFGEYKAYVVRSSADEVVVKVPYQLDQLQSEIALSLGSQTAAFTNKFTLKSPIIQSISPTSAIAGTEVTLIGEYLNSSKTVVLFGDRPGLLKSITKTKIVCLIPTGPTGTVNVSVRTGEGDLVDDIAFEIQ